MIEPVNVLEFEALAKERIEPAAWDYILGGAEDETVAEIQREHFGLVVPERWHK